MGRTWRRGRWAALVAAAAASAVVGSDARASGATSSTTENHLITTVSCTPRATIIDKGVTCTTTVTDDSKNPTTPGGDVEIFSTGGYTNTSSGTCELAGSGATASCAATYSPTQASMLKDDVMAAYAPDLSGPVDPILTCTTVTIRKRPVVPFIECTIPGGPEHNGTCSVSIADNAPGLEALPAGGVGFTATPAVTFAGPPCILQEVGPVTNESSCTVLYYAKKNTPSFTVTGTYQPVDSVHRTSSVSTTVNPPN
jgi:hypothetical protein